MRNSLGTATPRKRNGLRLGGALVLTAALVGLPFAGAASAETRGAAHVSDRCLVVHHIEGESYAYPVVTYDVGCGLAHR
ncbi:hypothetical protein LO772_02135 [Yinghuangia sp. ASG 101]|uniref:hypothetical protein n=1 Tax=Yinghuangia sp. ASG 101 TaxID=2896848 RepID=UPI001E62362E|nr:hypothetical protein [Yinghuangia sp. ASG 101]UGQ12435.1 hypothetical protein LO772_02135 [Yinghuangia sp. ASG 101]